MKTKSKDDARPRARKLREQMRDLIGRLRAEGTETTDISARALFETSAEVLTGLAKAFDDYEQKNEAAWQNSES